MLTRRVCIAAVIVVSLLAAAQVQDNYYSAGLDKLWKQAYAASQAGDRDKAFVFIEKARKAAPGDDTIAMSYATALARQGKIDEARAIFDEIATRNPGIYPVNDPRFAEIAKDARFAPVVRKFEAANAPIIRSEVAFTIPERDLIPEGIAYDSADGSIYVGSIAKEKIVRIGPDGKIVDLTKPDAKLWNVLGMKVDPKRRWLWVATAQSTEPGAKERGAALIAVDLTNGNIARRFAVDDGETHLFNDLDFAPNGDIYFTDSTTGAVWTLPREGKEVTKVLPSETFIYPNGIIALPDGKRLLVASFGAGITIVDLATRRLSKLPHPADTSTGGIDGMYLDGRSIVAVVNSNGPERVVRFHLNAAMDHIDRGEVLERRHPKYNPPTTGAIAGRHFYTLANAQLDAYENGKIKPDAKLEDVVILKMPVDGGKAPQSK